MGLTPASQLLLFVCILGELDVITRTKTSTIQANQRTLSVPRAEEKKTEINSCIYTTKLVMSLRPNSYVVPLLCCCRAKPNPIYCIQTAQALIRSFTIVPLLDKCLNFMVFRGVILYRVQSFLFARTFLDIYPVVKL